MTYSMIKIGNKQNDKPKCIVVDRNVIIVGETGVGKTTYIKRLAENSENVLYITADEFIKDDVINLEKLKNDKISLVIVDDLYKVTDVNTFNDKVNKLNAEDIYVGLTCLEETHIKKFPVNNSYILKLNKSVDGFRSLVYIDGNNSERIKIQQA